MNRIFVVFVIVLLGFVFLSDQSCNATVPDPNFHIYLCFGQSNMEGNAAIGDLDRIGVDSRFKVMTVAPDDYLHLGRTVGNWYTAVPPLCRWDTGLTPADYFGRVLVDSLPSNIKIGVIVVAMGGSGIDAFDKDNYTQYYQNADAFQKGLMDIYGGNPYDKIIEMAKLAQQSGVIKGILLHQGESNNGQPDWPGKVQKIYNDILGDLNLAPNSVPLLAGEMLQKDQGGLCWGMNSIIATLPYYITNSYVISSIGCEGNGKDLFHFSTAGARELGSRYGKQMYSLLKTYNTVDGQTVDHLSVDNQSVSMLTGSVKRISLRATYKDGHTQDITTKAAYAIGNPSLLRITNGYLEPLRDGATTVTASFKGELGEVKQINLNVSAVTFPLKSEYMDLSMFGTNTFDDNTRTLHISQWGQAGWSFANGVDLSGYKYLVFKFGTLNYPWGTNIHLKDGNTESKDYTWQGQKQLMIDLQNVKTNEGVMITPNHITAVRFWSSGGDLVVDKVYLTNKPDGSEETTGVDRVTCEKPSGDDLVDVYTITGMIIKSQVKRSEAKLGLSDGVYVIDRQKVVVMSRGY
ncbi:MAG: sialate O-acetylesterase [Bacteroidota bacterium]|nr:sialate O-acetylesterase [Bacteroidota bacterium]